MVASEILIFYNSPVLEKMVFVIGGWVVSVFERFSEQISGETGPTCHLAQTAEG